MPCFSWAATEVPDPPVLLPVCPSPPLKLGLFVPGVVVPENVLGTVVGVVAGVVVGAVVVEVVPDWDWVVGVVVCDDPLPPAIAWVNTVAVTA